jgi:hypothetical protein
MESWVPSWPYYVPLAFFHHVLFLGVLLHLYIYKAFVLGGKFNLGYIFYDVIYGWYTSVVGYACRLRTCLAAC